MTGLPFTPAFTISGAGTQNITGNVVTTNPGFATTPNATTFNNSATSGVSYEGPRIGVVKGCDPYTHSSDPFNRLNPACFFAPSPGSLGLESGVNYVYGPGGVNFDMSLQKVFAVKERVRFQLRLDAFNVFNHTIFTGYNYTLNFNGYPNSGGAITGS